MSIHSTHRRVCQRRELLVVLPDECECERVLLCLLGVRLHEYRLLPGANRAQTCANSSTLSVFKNEGRDPVADRPSRMRMLSNLCSAVPSAGVWRIQLTKTWLPRQHLVLLTVTLPFRSMLSVGQECADAVTAKHGQSNSVMTECHPDPAAPKAVPQPLAAPLQKAKASRALVAAHAPAHPLWGRAGL